MHAAYAKEGLVQLRTTQLGNIVPLMLHTSGHGMALVLLSCIPYSHYQSPLSLSSPPTCLSLHLSRVCLLYSMPLPRRLLLFCASHTTRRHRKGDWLLLRFQLKSVLFFRTKCLKKPSQSVYPDHVARLFAGILVLGL
jgi:hypothetical protein